MTARRFIIWLWLLSGLPVGIALLALPPEGRFALFALGIALETGHSVSPIAASWLHPVFRQIMLARPWKFLGLPIAIAIPTVAIGIITSLHWTSLVFGRGAQWRVTDLTNPFPIVVWIYTVWNCYHFGMQNFGVLSLLRGHRGQWQRTCDMSWCVGFTIVAMFIAPTMTAFNHWVTEIGLCGRVSRNAIWFVLGILLVGAIGFLWEVPTAQGALLRVIPAILCARLALGFWHFLQDRWMWNLSNPQVRATIGKELFA